MSTVNPITVSNCTFINTGITSTYWSPTITSTASTTGNWYSTSGTSISSINDVYQWIKSNDSKLDPGTVHKLPDGSKLCIDFNGNYEIVDHKAKVTYKSNNIREFNKYVSSSDVLEAFIKDVGKLGVKQSEVFSLPIELFINWLIIRAAEKDGEVVEKESFEKQVRGLLTNG